MFYAFNFNKYSLIVVFLSDRNRNNNRNLGISKAPLKSQAHHGTMLFIERCDKSNGLSKW